MTSLTDALFASLLLHRGDHKADRRSSPIIESGVDEDLRAARDRAKARR